MTYFLYVVSCRNIHAKEAKLDSLVIQKIFKELTAKRNVIID